MNENTDNQERFVRAFAAAEPVLRRYIMAHVPRAQAAEDVLQDVAVILWKKFGTFRADGHFERWAFGIARNVIMHSRRTAARDRLVFGDDLERLLSDRVLRISKSIHDRKAALRECLKKLSDKLREAMMMRYADEASSETVAASLGLSANALRIQMHRTRKALIHCVDDAMRGQEESA